MPSSWQRPITFVVHRGRLHAHSSPSLKPRFSNRKKTRMKTSALTTLSHDGSTFRHAAKVYLGSTIPATVAKTSRRPDSRNGRGPKQRVYSRITALAASNVG